MLTRLLVLLSVTSLVILSHTSYACDTPIKGKFSKQEWRVTKVYCPVGCSNDLMAFLKSYQGKTVQLSPVIYEAPYADPCDGEVHMKFEKKGAKSVIEDLNRGVEPRRRKMSVTNLKLPTGVVTGATIFCKTADYDLPVGRLLSIEPEKVLVLFEGPSIIELR